MDLEGAWILSPPSKLKKYLMTGSCNKQNEKEITCYFYRNAQLTFMTLIESNDHQG